MTLIQGQFWPVLLFKYTDKICEKPFDELRQGIEILL